MEGTIHKITHEATISPEAEKKETDTDIDIRLPFKTRGSIEFGIGEYGMAWLGNIVLLFGITFLTQNLQNSGNTLFAVITGYASVAAIYAASFYAKRAYSYLSKLLFFNGHIILYYLTLRLYFFQEYPLIKNPAIVLILLIFVTTYFLFLAYKKQSQFQFGFVLLLLLGTGVVSNSTHFLLAITLMISVFSLLMYQRFNWLKMLFFFITLIYFVQLNWLLNNPVITKLPQFRPEHEFGILYLIANAVVFSLLAILPKKEDNSEEIIISAIIWNGLGFTAVMALTVVTYFTKQFIFICGIISLFCLLYSFLLKKKSFLKIAAPLYAIYGFVAMSIFIYGIFLLPKAYLFLAVQSFLVVSVALWFRSRFMVIANIFLFILLLILYLKDPVNDVGTNFAFMLVAFITARVMNWKKERLNLKTDFIRNLYLISGFIMTLISFHHAMPKSYITVSWIAAAIFFFVFGYLIKNIKYRWLAIATLIASAVNLVFVDMKNMEIGFRILIFLVMAVISIAVSIVYTKFVSAKKDQSYLSEKETKKSEIQ